MKQCRGGYKGRTAAVTGMYTSPAHENDTHKAEEGCGVGVEEVVAEAVAGRLDRWFVYYIRRTRKTVTVG